MNDRQDLGDFPPEEFRKQLHQLADWIADYREHIEELRVAPDDKPGAILAALPAQPPEEGDSFEKILSDVDRLIVPGMVHWGHPMFLGYFGWTTTAPGILGEITASVGVMHALAVAREEAAPETRKLGLAGRADLPTFRIYASRHAHSSAEKAAIALGLGEQNVQRVACDADFRMDPSALSEMIAHDRRAKFKPLATIATVGTTSTASVDPISEIAQICREHKMWLHVDGAYGAGLALLPEQKWVTSGWSKADSLVVNPHKMLFVPLDFSVLYMRDLERLRRVFTIVPEYLRGDTVEAEKNYMDYGVQLGRRFRALKAWMVFRAFGRAGMAARIREHLRLAHLLTDWIRIDSRFELAAPVVMPVVCFRFVAGIGDAGPRSPTPATTEKLDKLNSEIVERINASGRAYLTQTKLRGRTVMRIGLGNILTNEQHLRKAWDMICNTAEAL